MPIYTKACSPEAVLAALRHAQELHESVLAYNKSLLPTGIKNTVNAHSDELYRACDQDITKGMDTHQETLQQVFTAKIGEEISEGVYNTLKFLLGTVRYLEEEVRQFTFLAAAMKLTVHRPLIRKSQQQLDQAVEALTQFTKLGLKITEESTWSQSGTVADIHKARMKDFEYFKQHGEHKPLEKPTGLFCSPCNFFTTIATIGAGLALTAVAVIANNPEIVASVMPGAAV